MTFKNALLGTVFSASLAFCGHSALAQESAISAIPGEFEANITLTSDYVDRGISQSDEGPALQGGVEYTYDNEQDQIPGVYVGTWASTVDFNSDDDAWLEMNVYGGLKGALERWDANWDLGVNYIFFPGTDSDREYNYWEYSAALSKDYGVFKATASYIYSSEFSEDLGYAHYPSLEVEVPLPLAFNANAHVGYQAIEDADNYTDWSLGLGYAWDGFDFGLTYADTDLKDPEECDDVCSARFVLSVSKTF